MEPGTKKQPQLTDDELTEIIASKVTAENADSGWVVALLMMRMLPLLRQSVEGQGELINVLRTIDSALAPDLHGHSIASNISNAIANAADYIKRGV